MDNDFVVKYEGGHSEDHRLPAYFGVQSLYGVARSLTVVGHYAATGKVRFRAPYVSGVNFFLKPSRPGSFESIFELVTNPAVLTLATPIATGISANLITNLMQSVWNRTLGNEIKEEEKKEPILTFPDSDLDVLAEAITPATKQAHLPIGNGVGTINIYNGPVNIINIDSYTKEYINNDVEDRVISTQDVSISSYNAINKIGRAFFKDLGRNIPFNISKNADSKTRSAISWSIDRYTNDQKSFINIQFYKILSHEGQIKRIIINKAELIDREN